VRSAGPPPVSDAGPATDVDIDGERFPGKVRSCDELADGSWSCLVTVELEPGQVRTARVDPKNLSWPRSAAGDGSTNTLG
jgi:hypothetical protein